MTAEPDGSGSLALTGVNSTALRWLLLFGGLLLVGGSLGRRATRKKTPRQGRTLLVLLLVIAGSAVATQQTGKSGTIASSQRSLPHVPRSRAAFGPRLFGRSHRPPTHATDPDRTTAKAIESPNWSGYVIPAAEAAPITDIQGSWTVPNVALSWAPTYSSTWIGLGGGVEGDEALAQVGTEQDSLYGFTYVSSWWSTAAQDFLGIAFTNDQDGDPFATNPGDAMSAEVQQSSAGEVFFTLTDNSTGQIASITTDYQGSGRSAEWIVEAPSLADASGGLSVTTLADYGSTVFDNLGIDQEGNVDLSATEAVVMQQGGVVTSDPSAPSASGNAFTLAYGSSQPSPPEGDTPLVRSEAPRRDVRLVTAPDELALPRGRFVSP